MRKHLLRSRCFKNEKTQSRITYIVKIQCIMKNDMKKKVRVVNGFNAATGSSKPCFLPSSLRTK